MLGNVPFPPPERLPCPVPERKACLPPVRLAALRGQPPCPLFERVVVIAGVLPSCHLIWVFVLSSWVVDIGTLPALHAWFADWIVRPRILLVLTVVFLAGFVCLPFAKNGGRMGLAVLKGLSTLVVVLALRLSAIAFAALVFPVRWSGPGEQPGSVLQPNKADKMNTGNVEGTTGTVPDPFPWRNQRSPSPLRARMN